MPGTSITYTITIGNGGPSTAMDVTVTDEFPAEFTHATWTSSASGVASGNDASGSGNVNDTGITLAAGAAITYTVDGFIEPRTSGPLANTAKVTAGPLTIDPVLDNNSATASVDVQTIQIVKFVNGLDADTPTGPVVAVGSTVTFTYLVTNVGSYVIQNVVVTDDKLGSITSFTGDNDPTGFLDLGETWVYTATTTALAGQQTNIGTVTGETTSGFLTTDTNPATYFGGAP